MINKKTSLHDHPYDQPISLGYVCQDDTSYNDANAYEQEETPHEPALLHKRLFASISLLYFEVIIRSKHDVRQCQGEEEIRKWDDE